MWYFDIFCDSYCTVNISYYYHDLLSFYILFSLTKSSSRKERNHFFLGFVDLKLNNCGDFKNMRVWPSCLSSAICGRLLSIYRAIVRSRPVTDEKWLRQQNTFTGNETKTYLILKDSYTMAHKCRPARVEAFMPCFSHLWLPFWIKVLLSDGMGRCKFVTSCTTMIHVCAVTGLL